MEDAFGLTEDQKKTWLAIHWQGSKACPLCGINSWAVGEEVALLGRHPLVVVACTTCGYTLLLNAVVIAQGARRAP